jgi:hypothetical protein
VVRKALGIAAVSALILACGSSSSREAGFNDGANGGNGSGSGSGDNTGSLGGTGAPAPEQKAEECTKMDIVFIVDDSGSMKEEQENLAANFPKFVEKIQSFTTKSGEKLDWRLAVTTTGRNLTYSVATPFGPMAMTEKGDDGAFRMKKECGTTKRWVEKNDPNAVKEFSCLAKAGTSGASIEMPLYATELALVDRMKDGTNAGFLRPDALLAVVILTDEDDCSREDNNFTVSDETCDQMKEVRPVAEYKQMLDTVANGAGRWATAVIAGDKQCSSAFGDAIEAKRLKDFVALAGKNGTFASICDGDLTKALSKALDTFDAACRQLPPPVK